MRGSMLRTRRLRPLVGALALTLLAASAFAVTTNVTVAGAPPDQVGTVTLRLLDGTTVQAERDDNDPTGALWIVNTAERILAGTPVDVTVGLVGGQTEVFFTAVGSDGAVHIDAAKLYTASTSGAESASNSVTVQTTPGNVVKWISNVTYPLPRLDYVGLGLTYKAPRRFFNSALWGIGPRFQDAANAAGNASGDVGLTDSWKVGDPFNFAGQLFRYAINPSYSGFSGAESGVAYEDQVADALAAIRGYDTAGSVAQDSSEWCQYGSGVGHPVGFYFSLGNLLGAGPLNLEVNLSGGGQSEDDWTSLGDYLSSPEFAAGGGVFSGALDPGTSALNQSLNDAWSEALQRGHDLDPIQGVADRSGTVRLEDAWAVRNRLRLRFDDFGTSGGGEAATTNEGNPAPGEESADLDSAVTEDERIVVTGSRISQPSLVETSPLEAIIESTNAEVSPNQEIPDALKPFQTMRLRIGATDWTSFRYGTQFANLVEPQINLAGTTHNNSCRDKAPGPFLDWSDPNVKEKYRAHESGPEPFVLRLP